MSLRLMQASALAPELTRSFARTSQALDSHSAGFPPAHLPQALQEGVEEALGDQGVDVDAITAASGSVLGLSTGVAGLAVAE